MYNKLPYFVFLKRLFVLLILLNLLEQVAVVSILHDDAKERASWNRVVHECLVVIDNVGVVLDGSQYPDLVYRVVPLLVREAFDDSDFLKGIDEVILLSNDFINGRITALSELLQDLEVFDRSLLRLKAVRYAVLKFVVDSVNSLVAVDAVFSVNIREFFILVIIRPLAVHVL